MDMNDDDENEFACDAERVDIYGIGKAFCPIMYSIKMNIAL
jgi:hypothetical protein